MRGYVEYLIYPIFCEYETMEMNLIISNNIIHIPYIYIIVYIDIKELFFLDLHFRETEFPETKMKKNF